jgi:hypothetical protein
LFHFHVSISFPCPHECVSLSPCFWDSANGKQN